MIFNTEYYEVFLPPYVLIGISVLFSFLITAVAIPSIVRVSIVKNLMANPNGRTSHFHPTPNLGGVAIFAGVIISAVVFTGITRPLSASYIPFHRKRLCERGSEDPSLSFLVTSLLLH